MSRINKYKCLQTLVFVTNKIKSGNILEHLKLNNFRNQRFENSLKPRANLKQYECDDKIQDTKVNSISISTTGRDRDKKEQRYNNCNSALSRWSFWGNSSRSFIMMAGLPAAAFFTFFKTDEDELSVEDKILMDIKRAILAIKRDQLEKAEKYLAKALKESRHEKLDHAITQILDIQANLAFQKGEFDKAQQLFKTVIQRMIGLQGFNRNDNAIVDISMKLAQIYERFNQLDEAMSGYQYCIDVQKEKISKAEIEDEELRLNTLLLLAWASHNLSQIHMKIAVSGGNINHNHHLQTATRLSTEAYEFASRAEGPDSEHAIIIQTDLATLKALNGDVESALANLREVESIAKEKHKELYPGISVNIGNLYLQKGSFGEAEKICKSAKLFAGKINDMETFARAQECVLKCAKLQDKNNSGQPKAKEHVGFA